MKKIIIFIPFFLLSISFITPLYAQYGDYYDGKNSYSYGDMPKKKKSQASRTAKHYISIAPSLYIPTGEDAYIKDFTGVGGGFDARYKYNFFPFFGLAGTFRYNYAQGANLFEEAKSKKNIETSYHLIDMQILAVLQYDDVQATKGFLPYIGVGMDIAISMENKVTTNYGFDKDSGMISPNPINKITEKGDTSANVGLVVAGGLRYAFYNNAVVGFGVDWTYVFTQHDYSGVRIFLEAGYRF